MDEPAAYELPPLAFGNDNRTGSDDSLSALISTNLNPSATELRQFRERKRYSLVDPGVNGQRASSPSPLRHEVASRSRNVSPSALGSDSHSHSNPNSNTTSPMVMPMDASGVPAAAQAPQPPRVRYNTFEEMGIKATKQTKEEQGCVIM